MSETAPPPGALPSVQDTGMMLAARVLAMLGPIGVGVITARLLGPEERGRYFFIYSLAQIAAQIANLGIHASNAYLAAARQEIVGRLTVNSLMIAAALGPAVAALLLAALALPPLLGLSGPPAEPLGPASLMALLLTPLLLAFLFLSNMAVAINRIRLFNALSILSGVAALLAAAVVGILGGGTAAYLVAAAAALATASLAAALALLSGQTIRWSFDRALFREGASFALRAYLATLLGFLLTRIGVVALQQRGTFAELGQFSIATQITDALMVIPGTVAMLLFPHLVRAGSGQRWPGMWRTCRALAAVMAALLLLVGAALPIALPLVFGAEYRAAVPLTLAMLPMVLVVAIASVVSQYCASEGFPWGQVRAWLIGFALQAGLSFALAGRYGAYGVAWPLLASNLLVLGLLLREAHILHRRSGAA